MRKHIDEVRCKLCKAVYPDESDLIHQVWTQRKQGDPHYDVFLGYFCEFCLPGSVKIVGTCEVIERLG